MAELSTEQTRRKRQRAYKATEGRCPHCGKILYSGGPVRYYEFPLRCNGEGCEAEISAEMVVV